MMSKIVEELQRQRVKALVEYGGLYPTKVNTVRCMAAAVAMFAFGYTVGEFF